MIGQGSPSREPGLFAGIGTQRPRALRWLWRLALIVCAVSACAVAARPATTHAQIDQQQNNLRLHITWGGGESRSWVGEVRVGSGSFSEFVPLGLEADVPGTTVVGDDTVRIPPRSPRSYDGFEVLVTAPLDATLSMKFAATDDRLGAQTHEIPLADLVSSYANRPLDEKGNRLLVRRAPGDSLRILFDRDSLVLSPNEKFTFDVAPHLIDLPPDTSVQFRVQLSRTDSGEVLWAEERDLRTTSDGTIPVVGPFEIETPNGEGVYDLNVSLTPWRLPNPFRRARPAIERKLQFVVIQSQVPIADVSAWRQRFEFDPASPGWWDRLKQLPQLKLLPGFGHGPLTHGMWRTQAHSSSAVSFIELDPGGWHAYPLPIGRVGVPHVLEIEYPGDVPQTLAVSIVEPNAAGAVVPLGVDSGVDVPDSPMSEEPSVQRHRVIFWPRTKTPLVLLTNRREDRPALFGKLRVLEGPANLPPAPVAVDSVDGRELLAFLDKPLFPENFGAPEAFDAETGRSLSDWLTFYSGARRLVEYLKHVGYSGAVVSVACEGSALYPSQLLDSTPKYDSGPFFATGQDPVRKDILEMLFRLFDREGLTLVPAIQFATPLPELEVVRRRGGADLPGIQLVDTQGRTWLERHGTHSGLAPYYNPLDDRVQEAMLNVVDELTERYGHHSSFRGLSLQLGPDTYAQLPGDSWGYDDRTIKRFASDRNIKLPADGPDWMAKRAALLRETHRAEWLGWRASRLVELHRTIQQRLESQHAGAKLYLAGGDMFTSLQVQHELRPTLPARLNLTDVTRPLGIDPVRYRDQPNVILARPQRIAPFVSLANQAIDIRLRDSAELDRHFAHQGWTPSLIYHQSSPLRLASFEERSPFGPERTHMWLVSHISPSGKHMRRAFIHSVAAGDALSILSGGWMMPLGQEEALREIVETYRRLPAERFQTATPKTDESKGDSLVVRTLSRNGRTYMYVVNDSPWPVRADLQLDAPQLCRMEKLSKRRLPPLSPQRDGVHWNVELQPYDMVAVVLTSPNVSVENWKVTPPDDVVPQLRRRVKQVLARANALSKPTPLDRLANPGFEKTTPNGEIEGWIYARGPDIRVTHESTQSHRGKKSVRLSSEQGVLWVRSDPFKPPPTGRVSVMAYLKIDDPQRQPPLRLAVEGRWADGRTYYRWAWIGRGIDVSEDEQVPPLKTRWQQYLFHVDDLPLTGLTELRVGFDLMGAGEVWLDEVEVYDRWFYDNERDELLKGIALADYQLQEGKAIHCQRFLESYWPQFLMQYVTLEPRVARDALPQVAPAPSTNQSEPPASPPSMFDRVKGWMPTKILPFYR